MTEKVFIEEYSTATGKGFYRTVGGERVGFNYTAFLNEQMIPVGHLAELRDGVLYPFDDGWFRKLVKKMTGR
jgi:hypothetical protein